RGIINKLLKSTFDYFQGHFRWVDFTSLTRHRALLGLTLSIQLMHLDQASVEHFISNLADRHSSMLGYDKRISCLWGTNTTNYFM
ncbi:MAG: hypothetical protein VX003_02980, partial [SAR324 cluster bacterium]|nr:hypothetical protein [SAR324 cluster bacterium]